MSTSNWVNALLPQEILTEILSLLPAKSLGRCKCVSKPWCSLIFDPQFVQTHLSKRTHLHQKLLIFDDSNSDSGALYAVEFDNNNGDLARSATNLNLDYPDNWSGVLGSCNGLILVADEERTTFLLNPTTLEAKKLQELMNCNPNSNQPKEPPHFSGMRLKERGAQKKKKKKSKAAGKKEGDQIRIKRVSEKK